MSLYTHNHYESLNIIKYFIHAQKLSLVSQSAASGTLNNKLREK